MNRLYRSKFYLSLTNVLSTTLLRLFKLILIRNMSIFLYSIVKVALWMNISKVKNIISKKMKKTTLRTIEK
jgi:hypothetical protein